MRFVVLLLSLLPVVAHAHERYDDVVFQRDTGAAILRDGARLIHIAPDDSEQLLPPCPLGPRVDLLLVSDGLWVRGGTRFAFFRPGPSGWISGTWLSSRAFRASAMTQIEIDTYHEPSPVIGRRYGSFHLRLQATESAIEEHEVEHYVPHDRESLGEVQFDEALQQCVLDGVALPAVSLECPYVQNRTGRLWLESRTHVLAARGDSWRVFELGDEPALLPTHDEPPQQVLWLDRGLPPISLITTAGLLTAGAFATPRDSYGDHAYGEGLGRTIGAMVASTPSLLAIERGSRASGAHDYSAFFLYPVALLLSPLPALSQAALSSQDHATHRGRGVGAAFAATLGSTALITPLTYYLRARMRRPHWATVLEAAVIGFATSVTYSYTAGLD